MPKGWEDKRNEDKQQHQQEPSIQPHYITNKTYSAYSPSSSSPSPFRGGSPPSRPSSGGSSGGGGGWYVVGGFLVILGLILFFYGSWALWWTDQDVGFYFGGGIFFLFAGMVLLSIGAEVSKRKDPAFMARREKRQRYRQNARRKKRGY